MSDLVERLRREAAAYRDPGTSLYPEEDNAGTAVLLDQAAAALSLIEAERDKLREALTGLMDCSRAIVGANTQDDDAAEAFDMYFAAQRNARAALHPPTEADHG